MIGLVHRRRSRVAWLCVIGILLPAALAAGERTEHFDRDPGWDGHNNRAMTPEPRTVTQDFGYSATAHAGGKPGEIGGLITPAAEPAYYARKLPPATFDTPLTASGTLACNGGDFHVLIGFFNAGSLNEWRTPNTIALRISGRGDFFYAWLEYATSRWRAGGDRPQGFTEPNRAGGKPAPSRFATKGTVHRWTVQYDPRGNDGRGVITASIGAHKAVCNLADGHRADGASFNRFGLLTVMKSAGKGGEVWLDDVRINGALEDFDRDPGWEAVGNRRRYVTTNVRPRFDFGWSNTTHYSGGRAAGEIGGVIFRGDCRYPDRIACYGDRLAELTLSKPLRALGKVALRRGVTDSTVLCGFYHSRDSMAVNASQAFGLPRSFLGVMIEGPSREGFLFRPAYRVGDQTRVSPAEAKPPHILPDGAAHDWSLRYTPDAAGGHGRITVTLDRQSVDLELGAGHRDAGARFDRFGIVTTWIDGNAQHIYFDDLTYTCKQE